MKKAPQSRCWVLLACAIFGLAGAAYAAPGDAEATLYSINGLEESTIYHIGIWGAFDGLAGADAKHGENPKDHNVQVTVVDPAGRSLLLVAAEGKDGPVARMLATMAKGDMAAITTEVKGNHLYIKTFNPYPPHDGEDRPGVYLFAANTATQVGGEDTQIVRLFKMGHFTEARVPNVLDKTANKKPPDQKKMPDPKLMEAVNQLHPGEMVQVEMTGPANSPLLQKIAFFPRAQTGVVEDIGETTVDVGKTPVLRLTIGPNTKTILVPGKLVTKDRWVPDPVLAQMVKRFKADDRVVVRVRPDGDKLWLFEIAKAPPAPSAVAAPK